MEVVPLAPGGPGIEALLEDYRRRAGFPEALVLGTLTDALASRQARGFLALEGGEAVGLAIVSRERQEGRIHLLHALPGHTRALPLLLERAEQELARFRPLRTLSAALALLPGLELATAARCGRGCTWH